MYRQSFSSFFWIRLTVAISISIAPFTGNPFTGTVAAQVNLLGTYTGTFSEIWVGCDDAEDDGSHSFEGSVTVSQQNGTAFSGGTTLTGGMGTGQFSGTITGDQVSGEISSQLSFGGVLSQSQATFSGSASGISVAIQYSGEDVAGDTCEFTGSFNGEKVMVTIVATQNTATEGGAPGRFTVTRTGSTTSPLTVFYQVSGSATNGTDYHTLPGSVVISAEQSSAVMTVTALNDGVAEGDETVTLSLQANASYTLGSPSTASVTIRDVCSFEEAMTNSVTPTIRENLGGIVAQAAAACNLSLYDAARSGGFSHFNWYQEITKISLPLNLPTAIFEFLQRRGAGVDPALGGNPGSPIRDSYPWYWDEVLTGDRDYFIENQHGSNQLFFEDYPNLVFPGVTLEYATYLAAIREDHTGVRLSDLGIAGTAFAWRYTQIIPFVSQDIDFITIQNTDPAKGGLGQVELLGLIDPNIVTAIIDLKPDDLRNSINPKSKGVIPLAVLGTPTFDSTLVDVSTLRLGQGAAKPVFNLTDLSDVNGDGLIDLLLHFPTRKIGIHCSDTSIFLTGNTRDGRVLEGSDFIRTVGCK
jgi:hypothetical protein